MGAATLRRITVNVSEHFTLEELTFSQAALRSGIDNTPPPDALNNLRLLSTGLLEPVRTLLWVPLHVDSGYRSPAINHLVGGAVNSAHLDGRAADIIPVGLSLKDAFNALYNSALPFDQLILECNAWLHLSVPEVGKEARRQALLASGGPGNWHYVTAGALD